MNGKGPSCALLEGSTILSLKAQLREARSGAGEGQSWDREAPKVGRRRLELGGRRARRSTEGGLRAWHCDLAA